MARFILPLFCLLVATGVWSKPAQLNEKFTTSLMKMLTKEGSNMVFSPVSLETALGVVGYGAKGETMEELFTTLGYRPEQAKEALAEKQHLLNEIPAPGATWDAANRIMAAPNHPMRKDYVSEVNQAFPGIEVGNFDFGSPARTAEEVNTWVADKTQHVIKKIIDANSVSTSTSMIILNAVYFKGEWKNGFNRNKTLRDCFFPEPNHCINTDLMSLEAHFKYGFHSGMSAEVIELPYKNEDYSMVVVLPDQSHDLTTFMSSLNVDDVLSFVDSRNVVKVDVLLPRFEAEFDQEMRTTLTNMGMGSLFSPSADLSGMFTKKGVTVDSVIHKAKITCNEEGTVAAASTVIHNGRLSSGAYTEEFEATRPFMYMIRNKQTGVLFSGTFSMPKEN